MKTYRLAMLGFTAMLAACGKPDATGFYLMQSDHEVSMLQLVQSPDGKVTGQLQINNMKPDGTMETKADSSDGAVSGNNLILKPSSVWFEGVQASGEFDSSKITLTGKGGTIIATKTTLAKYQQALAHLQSVAADKRQEAAKEQYAANFRQAQANEAQRLAGQAQEITRVVAQIRTDTTRLSNGLAHSPDFVRAAAGNTAKIERMAQVAPRLAEVPRGQLGVAANQAEVATNQIEVQRDQYAIALNQIIEDVKSNALRLGNLCSKTPPTQLAEPCNSAKPAAAEFKAVFDRGRSTFTPQKAQVQAEINKQDALIRQIDGR